jgi:predicted HicB family RNase H-like nuclease
MTKNKMTCLWLNSELIEKLRTKAKENNTSINALINKALKDRQPGKLSTKKKSKGMPFNAYIDEDLAAQLFVEAKAAGLTRNNLISRYTELAIQEN